MDEFSSVTNRFEKLSSGLDHRLPGNDTPERNAERLRLALGVIQRECYKLYRESGQQSLKEDLDRVAKLLSSGDEKSADAVRDRFDKLLQTNLRYLNGHGIEHLNAVDHMANRLAEVIQLRPTPYETFFLVAGVYTHDVGLIFGRDEHERRIGRILNSLGDSAGFPQERRMIELIAGAHGGEVPGDRGNKATIDTLPRRTSVLGQAIRPQMIAALIRLADELADDFSRATARPYSNPEERRQNLAGSEIFHIYSQVLDTPELEEHSHEVHLPFLIDLPTIRSTFLKGTNETYLLDEIFGRSIKCFSELTYCNRFFYESGESCSPLTQVRVSISIYEENQLSREAAKLVFTLKNTAYPSIRSSQVLDLCPTIEDSFREIGRKRSVSAEYVNHCLKHGPCGESLKMLLAAPVEDPPVSGEQAGYDSMKTTSITSVAPEKVELKKDLIQKAKEFFGW